MTPERIEKIRIEEIKEALSVGFFGAPGNATVAQLLDERTSLLAALEEAQQQKEMDDKIISVMNKCISRVECELAEAQQTIARITKQHEGLEKNYLGAQQSLMFYGNRENWIRAGVHVDSAIGSDEGNIARTFLNIEEWSDEQ